MLNKSHHLQKNIVPGKTGINIAEGQFNDVVSTTLQ
jgi:hypothetical protein